MPSEGALTYADLMAFPDDGLRRELLDGELVVTPAPRLRHQFVVGELFASLRSFIVEHGGGHVFVAPADVIFSDSNVVEPDVVFVASSQVEIMTEANIQGVPALVIEVLSDARIDRVRKRDLYARFGVPEYWVVDPDSDWIEVYRLVQGTYGKPEIFVPGERLPVTGLPGLEIDVASILAR